MTELVRCRDCKEWKGASEYHRNDGKVNGLQSYCKPCTAIRWARVAKPIGEARTAKRHNITPEALRSLLAAGCGVCGQVEGLDIDHDHSCCAGVGSCGKCIRGALCRKHNMALGMLGDDLDGVMRLVNYLRDES